MKNRLIRAAIIAGLALVMIAATAVGVLGALSLAALDFWLHR